MIQLKPAILSNEYRKKWNVRDDDFVNIYKDGIKINDNLYRVSGMGVNLNEPYFILLKQVESFYDKSITDITKEDKHHLENYNCILNQEGKKMLVSNSFFDYPYLVGGVVYHIKNNYYNVETGELYCKSFDSAFKTKEFIFIDNKYDDDKSKRGVMKINKQDGTWELFQ